MDELIAAIGVPARRAVLDRLREGPATAGELGEGLDISQPAVSKHLRVLREAGVVDVRVEGRTRVYSLAPEPLAELEAWLAPYRDLWVHRMAALSTEIARGHRARRSDPTPVTPVPRPGQPTEESA